MKQSDEAEETVSECEPSRKFVILQYKTLRNIHEAEETVSECEPSIKFAILQYKTLRDCIGM